MNHRISSLSSITTDPPLFSDDMPGRVEHSAGGVSQVGHPAPCRGQHGHVAAQVTEYCEHFREISLTALATQAGGEQH